MMNRASNNDFPSLSIAVRYGLHRNHTTHEHTRFVFEAADERQMEPHFIFIRHKESFDGRPGAALDPNANIWRKLFDFLHNNRSEFTLEPNCGECKHRGFENPQISGMERMPFGPKSAIASAIVQEIRYLPSTLEAEIAMEHVHERMESSKGESVRQAKSGNNAAVNLHMPAAAPKIRFAGAIEAL